MTRRAAIFLTLLISLMAGISNGNVLRLAEERVVTNAYDRTYRLVTETAAETGGSTVTTSYVHDKANNRTEKIVTGGSNPGTWAFAHGTTADGYNSNQVKSVTKGATVTTFLYDLNGNRTEKKVGGTTVQTYGFDRENRLTSLTDSAKGTFAYSYDHRTRRVGRDETGASGTEDEVSFAGGLSVQEYIGGSGTPTVEYVRGSDYGGGIGGVLYTIRGGSARSYNAYNSRGDVVSKTDQAGAITWQSSYEAFGTRTQEQGSTDDRQKANTKDEDPTGLLNEGMRYRDLEFGLFLTRDPAGFVDGPNVYTYVRQNPWTRFDPLGLWETGSYWGDVGQFYSGFGKAAWGTVTGVAGSVANLPSNMATIAGHVYDSATDANYRAAAPEAVQETVSSVKSAAAAYGEKLASGDLETLGGATWHTLSVATPMAATKATATSEAVQIANALNKSALVDDVAGVSAKMSRQAIVRTVDEMAPQVAAAKTLPEVKFSASKYPELAENITHVQRAGHPGVLTHGGDSAANRAAALDGVPNIRPLSRDEYPFASSMEGGAGSWVGHVPVSQQNAQGAILKNFFKKNNIQSGDQYRVTIDQ